MEMKTIKFILKTAVVFFILLNGIYSCDKKDDYIKWPSGTYSKSYIQDISGFPEQKDELLSSFNLSLSDFVSISTDSAWHLIPSERATLLELRNSVNLPDENSVIEKVIPLQDVATYMNNVYGGTIGGFVSVAADIKYLSTMNEIYNGLRLDYKGSKFLADGAGYSVIRFTSSFTDHLYIPYCIELGGSNPHSWPNTGGGFTSSTLGNGGYPEYCFDNYYVPDQGSEIYEITPLGNEILRARFEGNKWVTTEPEDKSASLWINPIRNGLYGVDNDKFYPIIFTKEGNRKILLNSNERKEYKGANYYLASYGDYQGEKIRIWGFDGCHYLITTSDYHLYEKLNLGVIERGVFGKVVPISDMKNIREETILK